MKPEIRRPEPAEEFYFEEGCYILESWNTSSDPDVSVARARLPSGVRTRAHCLRDTTERYVIVAGEGAVRLAGQAPRPVGPGDVVVIPPEVSQSIENTGAEDLVFYAICTPRFTPDCYRDLEESPQAGKPGADR
jgi:mannose-6-phosphate isomerase-like protein (cupin superfamily)